MRDPLSLSLACQLTFISEAEAKSAALEQALSTLNKDHPDVAQHITAEATAREELARISKELTRYRSIFGESSALETRTLVQQLETKDGELQKLRLLTEQQAQAETALFAEIDRLSSLWESLDQQVKKKVFDLGAMEEKLQKAAHEVCLFSHERAMERLIARCYNTESQGRKQVFCCNARKGDGRIGAKGNDAST